MCYQIKCKCGNSKKEVINGGDHFDGINGMTVDL